MCLLCVSVFYVCHHLCKQNALCAVAQITRREKGPEYDRRKGDERTNIGVDASQNSLAQTGLSPYLFVCLFVFGARIWGNTICGWNTAACPLPLETISKIFEDRASTLRRSHIITSSPIIGVQTNPWPGEWRSKYA